MKTGENKQTENNNRRAGILMPVSSLPSAFGIGTLGQGAYTFVDWLYAAGMKIWQVLPLVPTGYGDSPYQSFASDALNYYFIDFALLEKDGLFCFESDEKVMTAFMGAAKESPLMKEFLDSYESRKFDKEHLVPNTDLFTEILKERGLQLNGKGQSLGTIEVFPSTFFSAFNLKDFSYDITENTYTVHHFYGSWCPPSDRLFFGFRKKLRSIFGQQAYEKLKKIKKKIIG